jgi:hypothetical protein
MRCPIKARMIPIIIFCIDKVMSSSDIFISTEKDITLYTGNIFPPMVQYFIPMYATSISKGKMMFRDNTIKVKPK